LITEICDSKVWYIQKVGYLTFFSLYQETRERQEFIFLNCFASKDKTSVLKIVSPISRPRKKVKEIFDFFIRSRWSFFLLILKE